MPDQLEQDLEEAAARQARNGGPRPARENYVPPEDAARVKSGLAGRSFAAIFRSDREPERVEFDIEGHPAYVCLLAMDKDDRDEFLRKTGGAAVAAAATDEERVKAVGRMDFGAINAFIVGRTVTDFCFWRKAKVKNPQEDEPEYVWQQVRPPTPSQKGWIEQFFKQGALIFPEFWDLLVAECQRVSGLAGPAAPAEDAEGN